MLWIYGQALAIVLVLAIAPHTFLRGGTYVP
jgi:hypothetical protein